MKNQNSTFSLLITGSNSCILDINETELRKKKLVATRITNHENILNHIANFEYNLVLITMENKTIEVEKTISSIHSSSKNKNILVVLVFLFQPQKKLLNRLNRQIVTDVILLDDNNNILLEKIELYKHLSIKLDELKNENNLLKKEVFKLKDQNNKLEFNAKKDKMAIQKAYEELSSELDQNINSLIEINNRNVLLEEKLSQLNCLNSISKQSENESLSLPRLLKQITDIITNSLSFSDCLYTDILYDGISYKSNGFELTNQKHKTNILYQGKKLGEIGTYFKNDFDIVNFEKEDLVNFISTIADYLGLIIHRKETDFKIRIFKTAVEQSPMIISVTDVNSRKIDFLNPMLFKTLGYSPNDVGHVDSLLNTKDIVFNSIVKEIITTTFAGKVWRGTYKTQKKNGAYCWQRASVYPLWSNSEVTHTLGMSEDITDEMKKSEELLISKKNYEHISNNTPSALFLLNDKGYILFSNKKASEISGHTNAELQQMNIKDLIHADYIQNAKKSLVTRLEGTNKKQNIESCMICKDGSLLIVEGSVRKTKWMDKNADLLVVNDITERKRFSNLLKIQGNIDYLNSISNGIIPSFSRIFESLLQFNWIHGGGLYLLDEKKEYLELVFHTNVSDEFVEKVKTVPKKSFLFKEIMKKKPIYSTPNNSFPLPNFAAEEGGKSLLSLPLIHSGRVLGALNLFSKFGDDLLKNEILIFKSIGNKIAQMIALINTQNKLREINTELTRTLEDVKEKQQLLIQKSKLESLGEMAAGVAHEINQPLSIVSFSLENILFKVIEKKASQEYMEKKFNSIFQNIERIKEIIDHIRIFSRDQKSIIFSRVEINQIIKKAYSLVNEQFSYHNIAIALNLEENLGYTLGNNQKMEQVIFNLLSNAKYALEEKENAPSTSAYEKEIYIKTHSNDATIFIDVRDNGNGIEQDNLGNIFNPFFTTKPEGKGTGLGLSIVYGIITNMGGTIKIESERSLFTCIYIQLPKYINKT